LKTTGKVGSKVTASSLNRQIPNALAVPIQNTRLKYTHKKYSMQNIWY